MIAESVLESVERSSGAIATDVSAFVACARLKQDHREGGIVRRLFVIWNRGYKTLHVIAMDIAEALAIAQKVGHTKRGHRRWKDLTDGTSTAESDLLDRDHRIVTACNFGKSGVATLDVDNGWLIDGEPTWSEIDDAIDSVAEAAGFNDPERHQEATDLSDKLARELTRKPEAE